MNKNIDKVAWLYIKERKLLAAQSKGKTAYYIPGGKREVGESDLECLTRELKEELTIDFIPISATFVGEFSAQAHGKEEGIQVIMKCYVGKYNGEITPSSEIERIGWVTSKDISTDITSPVDKLIIAYLKSKDLID